jgi:NAD+ kinase
VRDVERVEVVENRNVNIVMLFDAVRTYEERVLAEQFSA